MRVGIVVYCTHCGLRKCPHGRSAPIGLLLCERECPGYDADPLPGCLWPGESPEEFGYECCSNATQEVHQP